MQCEGSENDELAETDWKSWELQTSSVYFQKKALPHVELIEQRIAGELRADQLASFGVEALEEQQQPELFSRSESGQLDFRQHLLYFHFCFVGNSCFYAGQYVQVSEVALLENSKNKRAHESETAWTFGATVCCFC